LCDDGRESQANQEKCNPPAPVPRLRVLNYLFDDQKRNDASEEAEALLQVLGVVVAMSIIAPMAVAVVVPVAMI
jgi:hypothetical protein